MSERDGYANGVPCWVEALQPDPAGAADFYAALFGWELVGPGPVPGNDVPGYLVGRLRGRDVAGIAPAPATVPEATWMTHVWVDGADAAATAATAAGGTLVAGPFDAPPVGRMTVLADPAGAVFCAWEPGRRRGAQLVNEPGAWSMSRLDTPDPERCAAFYADVFGWTTETFDLGDQVVTMFRLPGYVGGEPEQPVSREVVATMVPANGAPARWGVDFWVADADATAERATALGGGVVSPPVESDIGASAVLADPAGAPFSVTRIGPGR